MESAGNKSDQWKLVDLGFARCLNGNSLFEAPIDRQPY